MKPSNSILGFASVLMCLLFALPALYCFTTNNLIGAVAFAVPYVFFGWTATKCFRG